MFLSYIYWLLNDPVHKFVGAYDILTVLYIITETDMLQYPQASKDMHVCSGHVVAQKYVKILHTPLMDMVVNVLITRRRNIVR